MRGKPAVLLLLSLLAREQQQGLAFSGKGFSPLVLSSPLNAGISPRVQPSSLKTVLLRGQGRAWRSTGRPGARPGQGGIGAGGGWLGWGSMAAAGDIQADSGEGVELFDAHCHVHLGSSEEEVADLTGSMRMGVMSTRPTDWQSVHALCQAHRGRAYPAFGLHPWWAHEEFAEGWMENLRKRVEEDEAAIVGEIGLDRKWTPPGLEGVQYEAQMGVFKKQMELATELGRPVSLHCVHAQGDLFDYCRASPELPPAIYLHSFGGKVGMADNFIKMRRYGDRFYFGFSHMANGRSPKTPDVIARVPDDRLLLESDLEAFDGVRPNLDIMISVISEAKGWTHDHTVRVTAENARRFYAARR